MICNVCKTHAVWQHAFFIDTEPHRVSLCSTCAEKLDARGREASVRGATDHAAKNDAVQSFLTDIAALKAEA
ncbi:MAG: hypothetical protein GY946_04510 [bacterium]|nr:hypothetical protein [bacterium]